MRLPPLVWFVVDEFVLYRPVESAEIMTTQMRHLSAIAAMPNVTLQVLPAIAHPATASGFVLADDSAYAEHVTSGFVITDETVSAVTRLFDSLRAESTPAASRLSASGISNDLLFAAGPASFSPTVSSRVSA